MSDGFPLVMSDGFPPVTHFQLDFFFKDMQQAIKISAGYQNGLLLHNIFTHLRSVVPNVWCSSSYKTAAPNKPCVVEPQVGGH